MTLSTMDKEEQAFWEDFLEEVMKFILDKREKNEKPPFKAPQSIEEKYQKALAEYDGEQYCQIQQIKENERCHRKTKGGLNK